MDDLHQIGYRIKRFLNEPQKVFFACLFIFIISLFLNGAVWKVWGLYSDQQIIEDQILMTQKQSSVLDMQVKKAKDPVFIERQARDKLDMVSDKDLIFVFPD